MQFISTVVCECDRLRVQKESLQSLLRCLPVCLGITIAVVTGDRMAGM